MSTEEGSGGDIFRHLGGETLPGTELCWQSPCNLDRFGANGAEKRPDQQEQAYGNGHPCDGAGD
jgi:hypothetical protein